MKTTSNNAREKAALLVEVLPYIRKWQNKLVVIKIGGSLLDGIGILENPVGSANFPILQSFSEDLLALLHIGMKPVVVHGGGPQIGELMKLLGREPHFIDGQRVTDQESLEIVKMVLVGKVNSTVVNAINIHEPVAIGLSGQDTRLIIAKKVSAELGYVGEIVEIDPSIINRVISQGLIPVIATVGTDERGQAYNINADLGAAKIAGALSAQKLVFLTDVEGLYLDLKDKSSLVSAIDVGELERLIANKTLSGSILPKVLGCIEAINSGVNQCHIIDGNIDHAILVEFFTEGGIGTMVVK